VSEYLIKFSPADVRAMVYFLRNGGDYFEPMDMSRDEVSHLVWDVAEQLADRLKPGESISWNASWNATRRE
jgi:hypothetical protein